MSAADKAKHLTVEVLPKQLGRRSCPLHGRRLRRRHHQNDPKPSRLHRRTGRRPIQARHLPLLTKGGLRPPFLCPPRGAGWLPHRTPLIERCWVASRVLTGTPLSIAQVPPVYRVWRLILATNIRQMGSASTLAPPALFIYEVCQCRHTPASSLLRCGDADATCLLFAAMCNIDARRSIIGCGVHRGSCKALSASADEGLVLRMSSPWMATHSATRTVLERSQK